MKKTAKHISIVHDGVETPLTKDISDKGRQDLAYSMLYHMAEAGATVTVDGKQVDFNTDDLCLVSRFGDGIAYGKGRLDPEWYGANKDNYSKGDLRSVAHMADDYTLVRLAPDTASPGKADEMFNFLATSLDRRLSMSIPDANGNLRPVVAKGWPKTIGVVDEAGRIQTEHFDREWATGEMPDVQPEIACDRKYELVQDDFKKMPYMGNDMHIPDGVTRSSRTVHRIRALQDFGDVKAGDLGGYVESEANLSHTGECWVHDGSIACCDAVVRDDAVLKEGAVMGQAAQLRDAAEVSGNVTMKGSAVVSGHASVSCGGMLSGDHIGLSGHAIVTEDARVTGEVTVCGNAKVCGNSRVEGIWEKPPANPYHRSICHISGDSVVDGDAMVRNATIRDDAYVGGRDQVLDGEVRDGSPDFADAVKDIPMEEEPGMVQ